ncbi:hypothetical protein, partial [Muribaculum intestinale]|uniref:hypothetical protein n=1 Tax=Muribaculum intestinale TaxID=1796646 RepID=UPI0025AA0C4A
FALGGGLGRPRRLGIPSPEGERRMTNAHLKVLHFDLESSTIRIYSQVQLAYIRHKPQYVGNFGVDCALGFWYLYGNG